MNNTATRLSAFPDDPDHLLRWCAEHGIHADRGAFLPRRTYGRYLAGLVARAARDAVATGDPGTRRGGAPRHRAASARPARWCS